ncbi:hypothetical protein CASFOL_040958 [Castilleja foliolosa]|uniref:Uncharacterized protein n=1 Tax=Castilleja foliolosa TaxID=1961234 RepID=A0ABD3BDA4_9LAMI
MTCQRVCDIKERQKNGIIEIRIPKKWISKGKKEELCYQFVDAYGDAIEATADVKHIEHFDSVIKLESCYKLSGYIATGARTYMATITKSDVQITLWPQKTHLIGDNVIPGDIVAITSTMVTEHNGRLQLESTYLTNAFINPDVPETIDHVNSTSDCTTRLLHLTLKPDGQIVVNSVSEVSSTTATQSISSTAGTPTFSPTTPAPKAGVSKRPATKTPGTDKKMKRV